MTNATTRAHVNASAPLIPTIDLSHENHQTSTSKHQAYEIANTPIESTTLQNKRENRKQKKQERHDSALSTPANSYTKVPCEPLCNTSKKKAIPFTADTTLNLLPSMPLAKDVAPKAYPLLICSIGNPGATYANTLHSAGHYMTCYLSERKGYRPFTKGLSGLVSRPDSTTMAFSIISGYRRVQGDAPVPEDDWTFWQSTSLMNVSGLGVKKAYNEWLRAVKASGAVGRLVVVHDELESPLGKVTVRENSASAKGHNGLKSCQQQLGGVQWWRIGVGIGRPESRHPDAVSKYVLGKMTGFQRAAIEKSAVSVYGALESIAAGKT